MGKNSERDTLLIIDGSSLLTTMFFGNLPREILFAKTDEEKEKYFYKIMQNSKGAYTNAIFGFFRALFKILSGAACPKYIAIAWDMGRDTFRRKIDSSYKANRKTTMKPLSQQFERIEAMLDAAGFRQFMSEEYEADDYAGTLAARFEGEVDVRIMTKDNDYLQLVSENTHLFLMHSTQEKTDELYKKYGIEKKSTIPDRCFEYDPELVEREFLIQPASVPDLKGLMGDSSDNIKGVKGIGSETAAKLIAHYKTIEAMYEEIGPLPLTTARQKELTELFKSFGINRPPIKILTKADEEGSSQEDAMKSKKLATIKRDIDLGDLKLEDLEIASKYTRMGLIREFEDLEIKALRVPTIIGNEGVYDKAEVGEEIGFETIEDEKALEGVLKYIDETAENEKKAKGTDAEKKADTGKDTDAGKTLVGIEVIPDEDGSYRALALFAGNNAYVISRSVLEKVGTDKVVEAIAGKALICVNGLKNFYKMTGVRELRNVHDPELADYLLNPEGNGDGSEEDPDGGKPVRGKAKQLQDKDYVLAAKLSAGNAPAQRKAVEETGMTYVLEEIEKPLAYVLACMEKEGVLLDTEALNEFAKSLEKDIEETQRQIYERAGEEFNINSPKALGTILFEKLRLPSGKKTKTGYSTSAQVLEKIRLEDPIVEMILTYRQLFKLNSTYATALPGYMDKDGRVRTTFNQTATATGRLSSSDPNLQNIPIRSEKGRLIRRAFVADKGKVLVDADYSQIELRILSSMSGDDKLIASYKNHVDIHAATASEVFHIPLDKVTAKERSRAKAVNFGIVYGISSFGLGTGLDISRTEAQGYIDAYFMTYPTVRSYLDGLIASARDKGYSVTLFGRRRPIADISSANFLKRNFSERIAMNAPIQGTAADIMKIAMIRVFRRLAKELPDAKLILQVHDELLVEADEKDAGHVARILEEEMKASADLAVELEVGIGIGKNWGDAH
ncbi:MAG: DNA polymerase I [Lachnospiraceae bacterium]|nr:DNA polymerase I [Lachnospiraceae bacterium]